MTKWLTAIRDWFSGPPPSMKQHELQAIPAQQLGIERRDISRAALRVMEALRKAGYEAYLVGGGVRDLLLGGHPKDFDVATNATPEQVKPLFRNSRIIGRRFRIVHVRFGREIIEVTTFRGHHQAEVKEGGQRRAGNAKSAKTSSGMLLRDNVYGSMQDDAYRRDFTVNALYYCDHEDMVFDYTGGLEDIQQRRLSLIGDPEARYREDPVRMLRAVRFAAKLGFTLDPASAEPIHELNQLISGVAAARLFDEVLKLLLHGHAEDTWQLLQQFGLVAPLLPNTVLAMQHQEAFYQRLLQQAMHNTDLRIAADKPVTPAFIFAAMLWPAVEQLWLQRQAEGVPPIPAMHQAAQQILTEQQQSIAIPRRFSMPMREIWEMQLRLPRRQRAEELVGKQRFRAAYDFLLLREQAGEETGGLGQWWTDYQAADSQRQSQLVADLPASKRPRKRRSRHPRRPVS